MQAMLKFVVVLGMMMVLVVSRDDGAGDDG